MFGDCPGRWFSRPAPPARAADCTITVGVVMELTGPAGEYGQAGAKSVEMAFRDINAAGGAHGCKLVDRHARLAEPGHVAVDAATQLVQIKHVPVIIGGIISSVTIPILTAVTAPAKVVQVSPASSSPTLTELGREGKTNGIFFRTITSDALQGVAAARYAHRPGLQEDRHHPRQQRLRRQPRQGVLGAPTRRSAAPSSRPRPTTRSSRATTPRPRAGMAGEPDGLYLIATPVDGATIARAWISRRRPAKFLLNDGMNSPDFITSVGAQYLNEAYGTSSGTSPTASTKYFNDNYKAFSGPRSGQSGGRPLLRRRRHRRPRHRGSAGSKEPLAIRDAIYKVVDPKGTPVYAGKDEFAKALGLIKDGKPIRYEGVIGPVSFDQYGDITGPFRLWKIIDGKVTTDGRDEHRRRQRPQGQAARQIAMRMTAPLPRIALAPDLSISRDRHRPVAGGRPGARRHAARPRARRRCARRLCGGGLRHLRHGGPLRQRRGDRRDAAAALRRSGCWAAQGLHQMVPGARRR